MTKHAERGSRASSFLENHAGNAFNIGNIRWAPPPSGERLRWSAIVQPQSPL
jgi:hypothetical protein